MRTGGQRCRSERRSAKTWLNEYRLAPRGDDENEIMMTGEAMAFVRAVIESVKRIVRDQQVLRGVAVDLQKHLG